MMVLLKEKSKALAEEMGWSLDRAAGYLEGERCRNRGLELSAYHQVGIDEYAQGFRAGYFKRGGPAKGSNIHNINIRDARRA